MNFLKNIFNVYLDNPSLLVETVILITFCLLLKKYYPKLRGYMGEFWVKRVLQKLSSHDYFVMNDIMLKDELGTHQIDHIVLSNKGIFVIEMKNYYGLIKGREYDSKWCQYLGKNKFFFNNPIHQNFGHIKCLSSLLNIEEKHFISIVVFSNQVKLKVQSRSIVTQVEFLKSTIENFSKENTEFDIYTLKEKILSININDKKQRKTHVKSIRQKMRNNEDLEKNMICPKCGGRLLEKSGKCGKFIGCSNYPRCRYTRM